MNQDSIEQPGPETMSFSAKCSWMSLIAVVVVTIDQLSKIYAVSNWKGLPPQSFLGDLFRIEYAQNEGAFLSMFAGLSEQSRFWILVVFNGLILIGVACYLLYDRQVSRWVFFAFAFVVAGGIGNMIDRVRFRYVIDFFNIGVGGIRSGIFNVADMAITAGFLMMLPLVLLGERKAPPATIAQTNGPTETATGSAG